MLGYRLSESPIEAMTTTASSIHLFASKPLDIPGIDVATFVGVIRACFAKNICTLRLAWVAARLADFESFPTTLGFASVRIVFVVGVTTHAAKSFRSRAG